MVNKRLLPGAAAPEISSNHLKSITFSFGTAFALIWRAAAWESLNGSRTSRDPAWESRRAGSSRGDGRWRIRFSSDCRGRCRCERQLDVIANNMANVNTTGFKADKSLFEEYLMPSARDDNFRGSDRRISFVQDRATWHDFGQGPDRADRQPARRRDRRPGLPRRADAGGERYTRNGALQINPQGQLVTTRPASGARRTSGPIVFQPGDQNITIAATARSPCAKATTPASTPCAASCGSSASTSRSSCEGRLQPVRGARGRGRQPAPTAGVQQGSIEKSNVSAVARDDPHDRGHAHLHPHRVADAAAERAAQNGDRTSRRRSGVTDPEETEACEPFTPPRPA